MAKITLGIEYHGAHFTGWQSQPTRLGVQDALESAIAKVAEQTIRIHGAGRTDTGVHALMQVAHFETSANRPASAWVRGVNAHLPPWVRVLWAVPVAEDFHARFSALSRSYQYVLFNQAVAPASQFQRVGWYHRPLEITAMQSACELLLGEHDFSAFRASECQAKSPIRTMTQSLLIYQAPYLIFKFTANAFLQHQIRNIVGALIFVGSGRLSVTDFAQLLNSQDRTQSPPTFSPDGLYLTGVKYDAVWGLPDTTRDWT